MRHSIGPPPTGHRETRIFADASGLLKQIAADGTITELGGGGGDSAITTPSVDGTFTGTVRTLTAGGTIALGDPIKIDGSGQAVKADATTADVAIGVAAEAASSSASVRVLLLGAIRHNAWSWTPGGVVYLGAGVLTQAAPSGSGNTIQALGVADTADTVTVMPLSWATHT